MNTNVFNHVQQWLQSYLRAFSYSGITPKVSSNKNLLHGHVSTNLAFSVAKLTKKPSIFIAEEIKDFCQKHFTADIEKIIIAPPGFINFFLKVTLTTKIIKAILANQRPLPTIKKRYLLELVSANPTGFLHVGHARNACVGMALIRIIRFLGHQVKSEHYTNDNGNQIRHLALTVFKYYSYIAKIKYDYGNKTVTIKKYAHSKSGPEIEKKGKPAGEVYTKNKQNNLTLSIHCYQGDGYAKVAQLIKKEYGNQFITTKVNDKFILDPTVEKIFADTSVNYFLNKIKVDLKEINVHIDEYRSEKEMFANNSVKTLCSLLAKNHNSYFDSNGALWLKAKNYGDRKDRILIKSDQTYSYLLADLANHINRYHKNGRPDFMINIWGSDHHGYIPRMLAGLEMCGVPRKVLHIVLIQMVRIKQSDETIVKMSKRHGTALTIPDLLKIISRDALIYSMCAKNSSSHLVLDPTSLQMNSTSNPVFYLQYAFVRATTLMTVAENQGLSWKKDTDLSCLTSFCEQKIIIALNNFPTILEKCRVNLAPHLLCEYGQGLAKLFHVYYSKTPILSNLKQSTATKQAQIMMVAAVANVIKLICALLGISAPYKM